jgi:hypothetical protein
MKKGRALVNTNLKTHHLSPITVYLFFPRPALTYQHVKHDNTLFSEY